MKIIKDTKFLKPGRFYKTKPWCPRSRLYNIAMFLNSNWDLVDEGVQPTTEKVLDFVSEDGKIHRYYSRDIDIYDIEHEWEGDSQ